jgi:RimJ/RimL family protein N-acetyltransferase
VATVKLVAPEPRHADAWRRWRTDPVTRRFFPLPAGAPEGWPAKLAASKSDLSDRSEGPYRWIAEVEGVAVGCVTLAYIEWMHLFCEIDYVIAPEARGKGHGRAMVGCAIDRAFAGGLERVTAFIGTGNVASVRLVEGLGFRREGLLRRHAIIEGERRDHYLYALLKEEWRPS